MTTGIDFWDTFFSHKKIVVTAPHSSLPAGQRDCEMGIFSNSEIVHGGEKEQLLQGIMSACHLTPDDWIVFPKGTNYQSLSDLKKVKYLLSFGCSEKELNISIQIPFYQPVSFAGKVWIKAHSLDELMKESQYKKALWNQVLKPLFDQ